MNEFMKTKSNALSEALPAPPPGLHPARATSAAHGTRTQRRRAAAPPAHLVLSVFSVFNSIQRPERHWASLGCENLLAMASTLSVLAPSSDARSP